MSRRLPSHGVLAEFFDVTKDSRNIFKDTAIMQTEYTRDINSYPTIFLSFADAKGDKDNIVMQMKLQLLKEYKKNEQVLEHIDRFEKPGFDLVMDGMSHLQDGSLQAVVNAISFLMTKCHQYYGKRVMLFIDEQAPARPWRDGYNMGGIDIYTASGQSLIHGQL